MKFSFLTKTFLLGIGVAVLSVSCQKKAEEPATMPVPLPAPVEQVLSKGDSVAILDSIAKSAELADSIAKANVVTNAKSNLKKATAKASESTKTSGDGVNPGTVQKREGRGGDATAKPAEPESVQKRQGR